MHRIYYRQWYFFGGIGGMLALVWMVGTLGTTQVHALPYLPLDLFPRWTKGLMADAPNTIALHVTDIDGDGTDEIVTCGAYAPYVLESDGAQGYQIRHYGQLVACRGIAVADRNGDDIQEIYVAGTQADETPAIFVHDGLGFAVLESHSLPAGTEVAGLAVADVDGDGTTEVALTHQGGALVYDATTFALEWEVMNPTLRGELLVGDVLGGGAVEMVVNGQSNTFFLDAATQQILLTVTPAIGLDIALGDVNNDGNMEVGYWRGNEIAWDVYFGVWEGTIQSNLWESGPVHGVSQVLLADTNGIPGAELVTGGGNDIPHVQGRSGTNGAMLWTIPTVPNYHSTALAVGDPDNDGSVEIVRTTSDFTVSYSRFHQILNPATQSIEWESNETVAGYTATAEDIDGDGMAEAIVAVPHPAPPYAFLTVYDAATGAMEWEIPLNFRVRNLTVGQVDDDPALEITGIGGSGSPFAIDGISHQLEWQTTVNPYAHLQLANIDADPLEEIIVADEDRVTVFDGASDTILWQSPEYPGLGKRVLVGDTDGDTVPELLIWSYIVTVRVRTDTWAEVERYYQGRVIGMATLLKYDESEPPLFVWASNHDTLPQSTITAWRTDILGEVVWSQTLPGVHLTRLLSHDWDSDGVEEFIALGQAGNWAEASPTLPGYLLIGAHAGTTYTPEFTHISDRWGEWQNWTPLDLDDAGLTEWVWNSDRVVQVSGVTDFSLTPTVTPSTTRTPTFTPTMTLTPSVTGTATPTATATRTITPTPLSTATPTATVTVSPTGSATVTATVPPSATASATATISPTATMSSPPPTLTITASVVVPSPTLTTIPTGENFLYLPWIER